MRGLEFAQECRIDVISSLTKAERTHLLIWCLPSDDTVYEKTGKNKSAIIAEALSKALPLNVGVAYLVSFVEKIQTSETRGGV